MELAVPALSIPRRGVKLNSPALLVFETHPIQYRAPVYQALQKYSPNQFEVVYASDFSVRGYADEGFGTQLAWDMPLLSGYSNRVLGNDRAGGIGRWQGLSGRGVHTLIKNCKPRAILLHSFGYAFCWAAYWAAVRYRIPIWIRVETQDEAVVRGRLKSMVRALCYRSLYRCVSRAFYIGELNREHLLRHGLKPSQLTSAHYCTPDPLKKLSSSEKQLLRDELRCTLGINPSRYVVAFFGKLIAKKNPELLLRTMLERPMEADRKLSLLFVGAGELEPELRDTARVLEKERGIQTIFAGFINQSKLPAYYLASDTVVLPSRRAGETWGLVVNEALHAGCGIVISEAVGCYRDFGSWERVRTIPVGDSAALASALDQLAGYPRDFEWALSNMAEYSVESAARSVSAEIERLK
jgi:glycosyltransferase involved in cell wall biosynthesis